MADGSRVQKPESRRFWRIDVLVWADQEEVNRLSSDIQRMLCPDADHAPPCPIPWEMTAREVDESDSVIDSLRAQVEAEPPE